MQTQRRLLLLFLTFSFFAVLSLPVFAQQVIATVPVGSGPLSAAVNSVTNKIYVANYCGGDPNCASSGTVTVIDGGTNNTTPVNAGYSPSTLAVNQVTNRIYVANQCGSDPNCASDGTVTVIDGVSNTVIATVSVGSDPFGVAVNSVTNKIYIANYCGNDPSCVTKSGTVSVIDGVSNTVTATVTIGSGPAPPVVNTLTNKIYVANSCGNDPSCNTGNGTVTVIDGATNNPTSVNVGAYPFALDVNSATNKIYVANNCGDDPNCGSTATVTVIDGATLATTDVAIGGYFPYAIAVNSATNKIYVPSQCFGDPSCQGDPIGTVSVIDGGTLAYTSVASGGFGSDTMAVNSVTDKVYVANQCGSDPNCESKGTVTVLDGATLATTTIFVGDDPYGLALNSATNRVYVPNYRDATVSVMDGTPPTALRFVPLSTPCRAVDTRPRVRRRRPDSRGHAPGLRHFRRRQLRDPHFRSRLFHECLGSSKRTSGLPDGMARGTAAAFGFHLELAGWPHQGQRGDRARGHQRTDQRVRHQHDQCDPRRQRLLRAGVWFHAGFLSADALPGRRHAQQQLPAGPGTAVSDWRPGTRLPHTECHQPATFLPARRRIR